MQTPSPFLRRGRTTAIALCSTVLPTMSLCIGTAGCDRTSSAAQTPTTVSTTSAPVPPKPDPKNTGGKAEFVSRFDADRSFADLKKQVAFGPRVPNTPGHAQCREFLVAEFKKILGDKAVKRQDFVETIRGTDLRMSNIVAHLNPTAKKQIMLCAHWDTRPTADMEISATRRKQPIVGANDGASGVACLLELARVFAEQKPRIGVQFVLFDGEDYGPGIEHMFLGASHYSRTPALPKPDFAILIDMIGDKDLRIQREQHSENNAPDVNDKVWFSAKMLGITQFGDMPQGQIEDDHVPLIAKGWRVIDLIDFNYPSWHTLEDTPDKCAPESLKAVGDVLARVVYLEKP